MNEQLLQNMKDQQESKLVEEAKKNEKAKTVD